MFNLEKFLTFISTGLLVVVLFLVPNSYAENATYSGDSTPVIIHDLVPAIRPITDDHGIVNGHTMRSIPKWNHVKTDGKIRYVETLIFIDTEVKRWFRNDKQQIRRGIASLLNGINLYLDQINIRLIVVDVMEIVGYNITLEQLSNYRNGHLKNLPEHDLAILIRYGYEGGIAYVNGICGHSAVGITGFLPESPLEYAAVFFHELAHLLGLTHDSHTDCFCENDEEPCLKIDGFDECSVQALVERLPLHQCIQKSPRKLPKTLLPICGNHFLEPGEECDCGPEKFCKSLVCNPVTCRRTITDLQMFVSVAIFIGCVLIVIGCCNWTPNEKTSGSRKHSRSLMGTKTWDTPTFLPLKNVQSDPEIPIWKTPPYNKDQRAVEASAEENSRSLEEKLPAIPPRARDYVNIARPSKTLDNNSSEAEAINAGNEVDKVDCETVQPVHRRPIGRCTNKAIVRRPPSIPYLLDIGSLELPPKDGHLGADGVKNSEGTESKDVQRKLLINNQLNDILLARKPEDQETDYGEPFSRSLSEADGWNRSDESNANDALLSGSNGRNERSETIVDGKCDVISRNDSEQQFELLHSHL